MSMQEWKGDLAEKEWQLPVGISSTSSSSPTNQEKSEAIKKVYTEASKVAKDVAKRRNSKNSPGVFKYQMKRALGYLGLTAKSSKYLTGQNKYLGRRAFVNKQIYDKIPQGYGGTDFLGFDKRTDPIKPWRSPRGGRRSWTGPGRWDSDRRFAERLPWRPRARATSGLPWIPPLSQPKTKGLWREASSKQRLDDMEDNPDNPAWVDLIFWMLKNINPE